MWRDPRRAGWLMWAYFLLSLVVGSVIYLSVGPASSGQAGNGYGWIFSAFFSWRVTRGGRISRMLLILGTGLGYLETAFTVARHFEPATFGVLAIYIVQLALLMSPSVYQRTRPRDWAEPPAATRVLPPLTLLLLGVFAGLSVTLIGLAGMGPGPAAPGCDVNAALPGVCDTLADGTPLRWVTLHDGAPSADWAAMAKDWVQWSVVSASVLYGLWLANLARREPVRLIVPGRRRRRLRARRAHARRADRVPRDLADPGPLRPRLLLGARVLRPCAARRRGVRDARRAVRVRRGVAYHAAAPRPPCERVTAAGSGAAATVVTEHGQPAVRGRS